MFHIAALADIVPSMQHPMAYHHSNVDGTVSVLECARAAGVKRFLYTASSSCYGIPDVYPTPETAATRPQYPYALTKYVGEQYALHWAQVYKLPVVSLRLFNVYGPRSRTSGTYGAVFGVFLAQKLHGQPLTIVGDGTQTRDFTFVTDVVDAFVTAAALRRVRARCSTSAARNTYSVNRLAALIGGDGRAHSEAARRARLHVCRHEQDSARARLAAAHVVRRRRRIMLENIDYWRDAPVWNPASIADATKDGSTTCRRE